MQQEIGILHALGNTLVGHQIAGIVIREKSPKIILGNVGVNGHAVIPR